MKTLFSLLASLFAALSAQAATFTVNNNADSGTGSLRQAIVDSNVSPGPSIISFATNLNGTTIHLTNGQLAVSNSVTILGPGPDQLVINGNASSRVFYFSEGQTNLVAGLTITNGDANANARSGFGGGIHNDRAVLTVSNVTLSGNLADAGGGIFNDGTHGSATLTILNCTLSGNSAGVAGGGIYNDGTSGSATLTVQNSTLNGNSTDSDDFDGGGGIYNNGGRSGSATLTIQNSTLTGNSATFGGGIFNDGTSGSATLVLQNSTLSGNSADRDGGGIYNNRSFLGIATLTITHTLLAHGTNGGNYFTSFTGSGSVTNLGFNLSDDGSTTNFATSVTNLFLGPLTNNGGPTFTHALLPGSPAINAGSPSFSGLAFDQRGADFPRVSGSAPDIGAVELQMIAATTPSVLTDLSVLLNGSFQFGFTNVTGANFTVFGSDNVAWPFNAWSNLGSAVETPPASGQYQFTDPQTTNNAQRFYRVRSP